MFPHPLYGYLRKGTAKKICNGARNVSSHTIARTYRDEGEK